MKEREFQSWVVDVAERHGWRWWHSPTPMRPIGNNKFVPDPKGRGLPDLFMLHNDPPRLIFAELKNEDGDLSDEQAEFLTLARAVSDRIRATWRAADATDLAGTRTPVQVFVWRPAHRDLIEAILSA